MSYVLCPVMYEMTFYIKDLIRTYETYVFRQIAHKTAKVMHHVD